MAYEIQLNDDIGPSYYGLLDAKWFTDQLKTANGADINLHISCEGGCVMQATSMITAMGRYPGKITAYVDSIAASAASLIAVAANRVVMAKNAYMMVHNAWTIALGNAKELEKTAEVLRKIDGNLADQYVAKTGQPKDKIVAWLDAETWFTAAEAQAAGLADEIGSESQLALALTEGRFVNAPRTLPATRTTSPGAVAASIRRRLALARAISS